MKIRKLQELNNIHDFCLFNRTELFEKDIWKATEIGLKPNAT